MAKKRYILLCEIMRRLKEETDWSIHEAGRALGYSDLTVSGLLCGIDFSVSHYVGLASLYLEGTDWHVDVSEVGEVVYCALTEKKSLIAGVYDEEKKEILMWRYVMMQDLKN